MISGTTCTRQNDTVLVSPEELRGLLADPVSQATLRILDVRWSLDSPNGHDSYTDGHISGAVYADLETELSDHTRHGLGRHPLPEAADLERSLRNWGVNDGDTVIVYDDWNRAGSSRARWVLTAAGLPDVRILDGGLAAWKASGAALSTGTERPSTGSVTLPVRDLYHGAIPALSIDEAADLVRTGVLIDARASNRFRGESESIDSRAGHVPGARNLPFLSLLDANGRFRPVDELRAIFSRSGVQQPVSGDVGAYCGSGVTATVVIAAGAVAGIPVTLFPGSWSQWSSAPDAPIETGEAGAA